MKAIFLSDLHLEDPYSARYDVFRRTMDRACEEKRSIYILGDLVEVWVGDDDDGELAEAVRNLLKKCVQRTRVHLMHGNRDFLFGQTFAEETGVELLWDPHIVEVNSGKILLTHGDAYCTRDRDYQAMRLQLRSEAGINGLLQMSLQQRRDFAAFLRAQSQQANELKSENIMDVTVEEIDDIMQSNKGFMMVHGHTHRPAIHQHPWGRRYVLGDWSKCGWTLELTAEDVELRCFPIE